MRVAYLDAFSGISGDMTIGAFLDLGMPLHALEGALAPLGLGGYRLEVSRRVRSGIEATKFDVHLDAAGGATEHDHPAAGMLPSHHHHHDDGTRDDDGHDHDHPADHRHYREIRALLGEAPLAPGVRSRAQRVFQALAEAEGRIHGVPPDDVAFHEVGAVDAIVDVVGAAACLDHFAVAEVLVSPLPLGSGLTRSRHGTIPVPAPATLELLRGFPVRPEDGDRELVTPTGAAIVAALARPGAPGEIVPEAIGYGAGTRELADRPNLLRVVLGERAAADGTSAVPHPTRERMVVLEANIDDMNPEFFDAAVEGLFAAGARDVTLAPITMKKGRPATLLQVIVEPARRDRIAEVMLRETSTIGVRSHDIERLVLPREERSVLTRYGAVRVKVVTLPDGGRRVAPEYEDCRRAARDAGVPVAEVYAEAARAARDA